MRWEREGYMNLSKRLVLPFRWREFKDWFAKFRNVTSENDTGKLTIRDMYFSAGSRNLEGIKIELDLKVFDPQLTELFVCAVLADLTHMQLFEPFIGNPDHFNEDYQGSRLVKPTSGRIECVELFIPDQGWVLPSIWRFLVQSLGLRAKGGEHMPDILVFVFKPDCEWPLLFATRPFDYYGNAQRLKEELMLGDFYRLLNLNDGASENEVQRAYILSCREYQAHPDLAGATEDAVHRQQARFVRIKQGYQIWTEKLQRRREMS